MAAVDPGYAIALKSASLSAKRTTTAAAWSAPVNERKIVSPFALYADAASEADRELLILGGPVVRDKAIVRGARRDLIGRVIRGRHPTLGYKAGAPCFVIGAQEGDGITTLTVIRRLD